MSKIIKFEQGEEPAIMINHNDEFDKKALILSEFIQNLPLSNDQNERLIALVCDQIKTAEHCAYLQAFEFGYRFGNEVRL